MYTELCKIPFFDELRRVIIEDGFDAYFVGGCVRDIILGRPIHDVDLVCLSHGYREFASAVKKAIPSVWVEFKDNIRLVQGKREIDISKPRGKTLPEDLACRDFTINNLAMNVAGEIFGDKSDLENKVIRHASEAAFSDDPLRILRAFRFQAQIGFDIAEETRLKLVSERELLKMSASERIFAEMDKFFSGGFIQLALKMMNETGVYDIVMGGVTLKAEHIDAAESKRGFTFFCSSLFYDMEQRQISSLSKKLNLPNNMKKKAFRTTEFACQLRTAISEGDSAIRRLIYHFPDEVPDGLELYMIYGGESSDADRVMLESGHVDFAEAEKLNGEVLRDIGIEEGPEMGKIIKEVRPLLASKELSSISDAVRYIKDKF